MKKLGKKMTATLETVEAYACICSNASSNCNCGWPNGNATRRYYASSNPVTNEINAN